MKQNYTFSVLKQKLKKKLQTTTQTKKFHHDKKYETKILKKNTLPGFASKYFFPIYSRSPASITALFLLALFLTPAAVPLFCSVLALL
jgi:hypothetical protein